MAKQKKGHATELNPNRGVAHLFLASLISIFEENPDIKPKEAWRQFQELHPPSEAMSSSYPTEQRVKSKIPNMKVKYKKQNQTTVCVEVIRMFLSLKCNIFETKSTFRITGLKGVVCAYF